MIVVYTGYKCVTFSFYFQGLKYTCSSYGPAVQKLERGRTENSISLNIENYLVSIEVYELRCTKKVKKWRKFKINVANVQFCTKDWPCRLLWSNCMFFKSYFCVAVEIISWPLGNIKGPQNDIEDSRVWL